MPLHSQLLVNVATDPELTRSNVQLVRKRTRETGQRIADYRRGLVERLIEYMIGERFTELARRPDAKFLGAGAGGDSLSRTVDAFSFSASVQDGRIADGLSALAVEAKRVREFGFGAGELDRAKAWMSGFMERAYNERDKTESGSYAQEYLNFFLEEEPSPGIAYEYRLVQQLLPTVTTAEVSTFARTLLGDDSRVLLATSPQKAGVSVPSEADLQATLASADQVAVTPWNETTVTRELVETKPAPAAISARREVPGVGVTIVRFANGVEAWLKPTDFKNDQVLFDMEAPGGASLAPCSDLPEATLSTSYVGLSGVGGLKALDLQKMLAGKLASASPYVGLSEHGISGSAPPAQLETALQLLYLDFTAPNDDPEAFALLTRQLAAAVANRGESPQQIFADRLAQVNTSNHCTSTPLTPERVKALDRAKMTTFYRQRFANAADFTFFMAGAFKVDDALPLLARYVGSLPSTGQQTSRVVDLGIHFPDMNQVASASTRAASRARRRSSASSPIRRRRRSSRNMSSPPRPCSISRCATRCARSSARPTPSASGLSQPLPQRGAGRIQVQFGAAPENVMSMTDRVVEEIKRLQKDGPRPISPTARRNRRGGPTRRRCAKTDTGCAG